MKFIEMNAKTVKLMESKSLTPGKYPWKKRPDGSAVMEIEEDVYDFIKSKKSPLETLSEATYRLLCQGE